jgi:hypothetical protein
MGVDSGDAIVADEDHDVRVLPRSRKRGHLIAMAN